MGIYNVGLASQSYDIDGAFMLAPIPGTAEIKGAQRRATRTKTLDGGCVITDGGISAGDRTFTLSVPSSLSLWAGLWSLFNAAQWVTVSTEEACFLAKIDRLTDREGQINVGILIKEDLTI